MTNAEHLIRTLPDPESAQRFLRQFEEKHAALFSKLQKRDALVSDVLTLVAHSPLIAATLLQNPDYLWLLDRERKIPGVRGKEDLLESLARFASTHSQTETQVVLARFRRRELMRIFLSDIRRLATIAETTEDISNLADAILENALRIARQELDNRYGAPLETDEKGRSRAARFCIVSLGKLGSKELNYSSDIDLLFLYSDEGTTSGAGSRGAVSNREYFVKLAETILRLVGQQTGEGAAYRVDLRLRPHGRVGPLALAVADAVRYYNTEAQSWERQVLIRSRASAGDGELFKEFFSRVENTVFSPDETVDNALRNVRLSKQKIDLNIHNSGGYDLKLGSGGIREIEFIAQALQLAYGGRDRWLRAPHTLISLARLADRRLLSEAERTALFEAYEFLRRLEHLLQMEHGLQTHLLRADEAKRRLIAARMGCADLNAFESTLASHTSNVSGVFDRVFGTPVDRARSPVPSEGDHLSEAGVSGPSLRVNETGTFCELAAATPRFADLLRRHPQAVDVLRDETPFDAAPDYGASLLASIAGAGDLRGRLSALRRTWQEHLAETVVLDLGQKITTRQAKHRQTALAEASVKSAFEIAKTELRCRGDAGSDELPLAVLGLGKLGGGSLDYDSDLDVIFVYENELPVGSGLSVPEFYSRAAEVFVTALSGVTRDGSLYRVDLRLRPYGKNGASTISRAAFAGYMENSAAIWELLAYIKLRAVGGEIRLAAAVENETRSLIYRRAAALNPREIAREARHIRAQLERERSRTRRSGEIDIKYGAGGMLDVYFAMRFLQLRDRVADDPANRSTDFMLERLRARGSLSDDDYAALARGYEFISSLDHYLRLTIGRTTRVPAANRGALRYIASRIGLASADELLEQLAFHRLNIRSSYENVLTG